MSRRLACARRWPRRVAGGIAVGLICGGAPAQSTADLSRLVGFSAGPFVIAPTLATSYAYDTNVFFLPDKPVPPDSSEPPNTSGPSADGVLVVQPAVLLTLPFANSVFRLGDTLKWTDYQKTPQTAGKTANDALGQLILNFGSSDRLQLTAHNFTGVSETLAFDPGGEVSFQGHAYDLHTELASLSREETSARGYRLSLQRNALHFDPDQQVQFFNYRGFDGEAAYLEPLSSNSRLAIGYLGTRYDHYSTINPYVIERTEAGDTIYAQLEGRLGPRQPYSVRLGWERLAFTGNDAKDFSGLIGQANFTAVAGGGVVLSVRAQRQPFRSFFDQNNFYVFDLVGLQIARPFPQGSEFGGSLDIFRNSYDEPAFPDATTSVPDPPGVYRRDKTRRLEAYASLALRDHVALRIEISKNWRYSNSEGADYSALAISGGIVFGWN